MRTLPVVFFVQAEGAAVVVLLVFQRDDSGGLVGFCLVQIDLGFASVCV